MAMADDERFGAQLFREQVSLAESCGVDAPGWVHAQHSCSASRGLGWAVTQLLCCQHGLTKCGSTQLRTAAPC